MSSFYFQCLCILLLWIPVAYMENSSIAVYMGCYPDSGGNRLMRHRHDFPTLTPEVCSKYCFDNGYGFAGVEYSHECYCSKATPPSNKKLYEHECNAKCDGDKTRMCGGTNRIGVYRTGAEEIIVDGISEGKYVGCYIDGQDVERMFNGPKEDFSNTLTPDVCVAMCLERGFAYAGTQYRVQCFCSQRIKLWDYKKIHESQCNFKCSGNPSINCGGDWRMSVYKTGMKEKTLGYVTPANYLGCYIDGVRGRLFPEIQKDFSKSLTPDVCVAFCLDKGFSYAGTQYKVQCFCSKHQPWDTYKVDESQCNFPCSGNMSMNCGGDWRMSIYRIEIPQELTVEPVTVISTTSTTTTAAPITSIAPTTTTTTTTAAPTTTTTTTTLPVRACQESETSVNGKKTCQGNIIFFDDFKNSLGDKWRHIIAVPESPDGEFSILDADPKNSFVAKGNLVIKPTTLNNSFVEFGSLQLKGCTGTLGAKECGYQAFSFNILPPVVSARVNTLQSFTFRYGIVEVRVKLPVGDWLVPEIWLEPKNHLAGEQYYQTGRIRMAMCRGNEQLMCDGDDMSRTRLESGILMGTGDEVRRRSVYSRLSNNWHDYYHTYTLIWKPDSISFKIDDYIHQELVPKDKTLCEAAGFNSEKCALWESESKIAPFDNEFYISLGVSSGNSRDFPDNCQNRGHRKPWKNWEVKAMLKFWQDKENWFSTWSDDKSAMYVEYVRVTAL